MEQEILNRIAAQDELLQKIYISTEKTRKYFMWTFYGTLAIVVLPIIGLLFVIPTFLASYSSLGSMYGL